MKKNSKFRIEKDSLGEVKVPKECLWGAHTQRSIQNFSIGEDLIPREMIPAYAVEKKASALVNHEKGKLSKEKTSLICQVCDEILAGRWNDQFPLHVWMSGSGTQLNMNINEVIANRCSQLANHPLGSKKPVHPNDDVNMSQSTNDSFPTVMHIALALSVKKHLIPILEQLRDSIRSKVKAWKNIVKLGRTHLQDATPLTLGQEFSGYAAMLDEDLDNIKQALKPIYKLTLGGTAVGTGLNAWEGFDRAVAKKIAELTGLPFIPAKNKFAAQGAHNALVQFSAILKTCAVSLYKIANDIRLLACGPRSGFYELILPSNEPGSSIMPGKVNPTQCEVLCMVAIQVMANDVAVAFGGAGGHLEMNVYKPLIIYNLLQSIRLLHDSCDHFNRFLIIGMQPNLKQIKKHVEQSLMLATALTPVIGYDKAAEIAHYALNHDLSLREAALQLGYLTAEIFDQVVQPLWMCYPQID